MNKQEFLTNFTQGLRVDGKTRVECIQEIEAHLHELQQDTNIEHELGDPTSLARSYNITHLGPWYGMAWMYLTPFITWPFILKALWSYHEGYDGWMYDTPPTGWNLWMHQTGDWLIPLLIAGIISWVVVHALSRTLNPWPIYFRLLGITMFIGILVMAPFTMTGNNTIINILQTFGTLFLIPIGPFAILSFLYIWITRKIRSMNR